MPSTNNVPFWRKYFSVEVVVFLYFYGLLMYLPIGGIYVYQRVSDMKGSHTRTSVRKLKEAVAEESTWGKILLYGNWNKRSVL